MPDDPTDEGLTDDQRRELLEGGYSQAEIDQMEDDARHAATLPPLHDHGNA